MNLSQLDWTFLSLALFCIIGAFDGLYYHLHRYKLHLYQETKHEHQIHGLRGIIFSPIALLFFVFDVKGALLTLGCIFLLIDTYLEVVDIKIEDKAREKLGGITRGETLCHIFATLFRVVALILILKDKNWTDFSLIYTNAKVITHTPLVILGSIFCVSSLIGGVMHFTAKNELSLSKLEQKIAA